MSFNFNGKVALVTGANRGIGEGFVKTLLEAGVSTIYAAARDVSNLDTLVSINPDVIKPVQLDVTRSEQIKALTQTIQTIDILVNNAGIINPAINSAHDAVDFARQEMDVNLFGPMQLTSVLLPALRQSAQGAIINVSSIAGISNFPSIGTYSITKAAMHSYTQGLRADLADSNISVLGVYPGPIDTRMAEGFEMDKPAPEQVAIKSFECLSNGKTDVFPDDFSTQMYATFLDQPQKLADVFASMG